MGGEKSQVLPAGISSEGSPPRGRGKAVCDGNAIRLDGITPAWAGKRRCTKACNVWCWDHPRVGGEKFYTGRGNCAVKGSPPRGRGKDLREAIQLIKTGITPA